jgi:2-(1,2-epoxy-1,2-dihydrophenyl)acetyl-CoA isomerase
MPMLEITHRGPVAQVELNRPECLNALNLQLSQELVDTGRRLSGDDDVRAIILTGRGRAFCSGADLADAALLNRPATSRGAAVGALLREVFNPIIETWALMPKPVICAVNGVAAGGGAGLALCGDLLLMTPGASLVQVFVPKLALIPDAGVSYLLPRAVGTARALRLSVLGDALDAQTAVTVGVAHAVVEDERLLDEAHALALRFASGPREAFVATKEVMGPDASALRAHLEGEARRQTILADTPDHAEGLAAFAQKRRPQYR